MKVTKFSYTNLMSNRKRNITFGKGLTYEMAQEIQNANITEISNKFAKNGITNDFKDNKVVAWCCEKTFDIFNYINTNFKTKLALPKGIYVEDFEKLNIDTDAYGFCNLSPCKLKKNSEEIIPSRILFFNNFTKISSKIPPKNQWQYNWNYIDQISDSRYANRQAGTDFFLDIFLHEFAHASHEDKLLKKLGKKKLSKLIKTIYNKEILKKYQNIYMKKTSEICDYATNNPLEAIACDLPRVILPTLDMNTLIPTRNPFKNTPYEKLSLFKILKNGHKTKKKDLQLHDILRLFWKGIF